MVDGGDGGGGDGRQQGRRVGHCAIPRTRRPDGGAGSSGRRARPESHEGIAQRRAEERRVSPARHLQARVRVGVCRLDQANLRWHRHPGTAVNSIQLYPDYSNLGPQVNA